MGHLRERFNAKARKASRPTKRTKHAHDEPADANENTEPNALIHVPKSKEQKDEERRERLRQEVRCCTYIFGAVANLTDLSKLLEQQANSKITSKKKRRLEKYIVRILRMLFPWLV